MKITKNGACAILIALVFVGKLYGIFRYGADLALFPDVYNALLCPPHCWTFPESIPYSVVWTWINPLFLGRFFYGVYIFIFDAVTCILYWQVKRIPKIYLAFFQVMTIFMYLGEGSEYQNITVMAIFPLMFFSRRIFGALAILIKLPLGWSLPWILNMHEKCVWYCSGFTTGRLGPAAFIMALLANYLVLGGVFLWTIRYVGKVKARERDAIMRYCQICGKYWNKESVHFNLGNCKVCHRPTRLYFFKHCYLCARKKGF